MPIYRLTTSVACFSTFLRSFQDVKKLLQGCWILFNVRLLRFYFNFLLFISQTSFIETNVNSQVTFSWLTVAENFTILVMKYWCAKFFLLRFVFCGWTQSLCFILCSFCKPVHNKVEVILWIVPCIAHKKKAAWFESDNILHVISL